LPAEARGGALAEVAAEDPELARDVRHLLAADAAGTVSLLDRPASALFEPATPAVGGAELRGDRGYRLLAEIGRGGMGSVWLAERADGEYRQRVAIKLVHGGPGALHQLLARFRTERQILASLDHPHVARLLDGGTTAGGVPFLVMEYVEGERIDDYCERLALDTEARLRLVLKVCDAVSAAHQRLVVHRDLKPANILVTAAGDPKLLDFGIAKLLEPGAAGVTVAETATGVSPLTPRYASPEQVRGEPITTASDVYSLGVVLYELLAGRPPYREESLAPHLLPRAICEEEPTPPSTGPRSTASTSAETATVRRELRIDRDLDAIVLKALRKEAGSRYASVRALAEDIERFLDGRPVGAHRGSAFYRAGKFVRRHRLAVAAAGLVALLLAGWSLSLDRQLERTRSERDKAEQVSRFLVDLFESADPEETRGERLTVREVLDRGAQRIESELGGRAEVRVPLQRAIGNVYESLGLLEPAERQLTAAVGAARGLPGGELSESLEALAMLRQTQARYDEAERLYREALDLELGRSGRRSEEVASLLSNLGSLKEERSDYAGAEQLLREAIEVRRSLGAAVDPGLLAQSLNNLAFLLHQQAKWTEAEALYRESLDLRRASGAGPLAEARVLGNLALLADDRGDYAAAAPIYREALALQEAAVGEEHLDVAVTVNNLASVVYRTGDYAEAERLFRRSLEIRRKILGDDHPIVATTLGNTSFVLAAQGKFEAAEPLLLEALRIHREALGPSDTLAISLRNVAGLRFDLGDVAGAGRWIDEAAAVAASVLPDDHPLRFGILARRASVDRFSGRLDAARREFAAAADGLAKLFPEDHPDRIGPLAGLADLAIEAGELDAAERHARAATEMAHRVLPPGHWQTAHCEGLLGAVLRAKGELEEGRRLLAGAVDTLAARFGSAHPLVRLHAGRLDDGSATTRPR
jgi:serine/threonine-protein kinase